MKSKKKILSYILIGVLASSILSSCSSDFLKEYSQDLARVKSADDLNELLVGDCYLPLAYFNYSNSYYQSDNFNYVLLNFMSDELDENICSDTENQDVLGARELLFPYFTWQQNVYVDEESKNSYTEQEEKLWTLAYEKINKCNMVMAEGDRLNAASEEEVSKIRRIQGECHFLRAFYYLTLANLYGKPYNPSTATSDLAVPIKLSESVDDVEFQRASVADVYQQIIADLTSAEELLLNVGEKLTIYHASIEAVYILRSRVALYMQDWQTAADYAKKAIDNNGALQNLVGTNASSYPISLANPEVVYSNGSSILGNILQARPQTENTWNNYAPTWVVSGDLYALFSDDDARKTSYVTTEDDVLEHKPTYHKIDNSEDSYGKYKEVSDAFSIRTAEAYLNLAEAKAQMGDDSEACSWLNKLRQKRIAQSTDVNLSGKDLVQFIRDERARELCFEGQRWFDLRRYSVDEKYPYSKEIIHSISFFNYSERTRVDYYKLNKNDAAYVLDIPKNVRDFQPSIGSNERPVRPLLKSEADSDEDDEGDDW